MGGKLSAISFHVCVNLQSQVVIYHPHAVTLSEP